MRLLAFGKTGQLARELAALGVETLGREQADLSEPNACAAIIRDVTADAVINAAAYTAVDRAEEEEALAQVINADAPGVMARACAERGTPFIHISTDYVFDGRGTVPRRPDEATGPIGAYGRSKLAGETKIREAGGVHAILRTSWVFSAHGANFVKTMLRVAENRDRLSVVEDQIGGPTSARALAKACVDIAGALTRDPNLSGTYHYSGAPDVSWAEFAQAIFTEAGLDVAVEGIPSSAYPTAAKRPKNSRLDCTSTEAAFGIPRSDWREELHEVLAKLHSA